MTGAASLFIGGCWIAWLIYWVVMAFKTKRTVERGGFFGYRLVALATAGVLVAGGQLFHLSAHSLLWRTPFALGVVSDCVVVAGVAVTVWARMTLGRNWSAEVTFKQDHELIESGPYALARHPIYTGLIIMAFGTAVNYGRAIGFALLAALCAGLWWKARQEERIMGSHFPDSYADYKARVHAIIPFLL
ncbi:MAG TPA: isoprenylcysteine carboxylmethyltransferase family protein [Solirubrobacteraceae bacterium]|jgi:protein-S-isoprenylcysteine O-methyltransferase Ste14|nr:isoprenylcysteine carboxylmethyltransferase family protein [Solirubrobacteraceae bacterium]